MRSDSSLLAFCLCLPLTLAGLWGAGEVHASPEAAQGELSQGDLAGAAAQDVSAGAISGSFLGAYAASNSNVLDDANAYLGITVTRIVDNSPAQAMGLRVGDILLEANGTELDAPERLEQLLFALPAGSTLRLRVERAAQVRELETRTVARLVAPPLATEDAPPPGATPNAGDFVLDGSRIERRYLGIEFRSAPADRLAAFGLPAGFGIEIARVAARSPLRKLGLAEGDVITELNGRAIPSAQAVVEYFAKLEGVQEVELTVAGASGEPRRLQVPLYRPERRLTRLRIPGIFSLRRGKDTSEYSALFGAFRWTRLANGSRVRLLWLIRFETGAPDELIDMEVPK